jgi:hypothetical protein
MPCFFWAKCEQNMLQSRHAFTTTNSSSNTLLGVATSSKQPHTHQTSAGMMVSTSDVSPSLAGTAVLGRHMQGRCAVAPAIARSWQCTWVTSALPELLVNPSYCCSCQQPLGSTSNCCLQQRTTCLQHFMAVPPHPQAQHTAGALMGRGVSKACLQHTLVTNHTKHPHPSNFSPGTRQ